MKEILHFNFAFKNSCLRSHARKDFQLSFSNSNMCKSNVACPMYYYIYWVITWCSAGKDYTYNCAYRFYLVLSRPIYTLDRIFPWKFSVNGAIFSNQMVGPI